MCGGSGDWCGSQVTLVLGGGGGGSGDFGLGEVTGLLFLDWRRADVSAFP